MRLLIGALVLAVCAWETRTRAQDWRTDQALWQSATVTAPTLPRPWLNLADAEQRSSQWSAAWAHLRLAVAMADRPDRLPRRADLLRQARAHLLWLDAVSPRCDRPLWSRFCASVVSP